MTDDKVNSLVRIVLGLLAEEMVKNIGFREKLIGELAEHIDLEGKVNASMTHAVEEQVDRAVTRQLDGLDLNKAAVDAIKSLALDGDLKIDADNIEDFDDAVLAVIEDKVNVSIDLNRR